jgi:hypothetical protein
MEQKIFELSDELKALRDIKKTQEEELKKTSAKITEVETALIDEMVTEEISSFKRNGQGFSLVVQNFPQAEPEQKDVLYKEFKERGYEHLFTINHQTLTSTLKEMIAENGEVIPDWLDGLVKIFEKSSIRIYKG